jgi:thiol:disulfide interchange protein
LTAKFAGYDQPPKTPGEYRPDPMQAEVVVRGHIEPTAIEPGGKAKLVLTATPSPGWHVYAYEPIDPDVIGGAKPTLIVLPKLAGWRYSPLTESEEPKVEPGKAGLPASRHHEGPITWTVELTAPPDAEVGEHVLTGYLGIQTCKNQGGCLPPQSVQFRATVNVAKTSQAGEVPLEFIERQPKSAAARGAPDEPAVVSTVRSYNDVAKLANEHRLPSGKIDFATLGMYMGFGLLGGFILNLMPCVLPVIGLKVLSFVQQGGESRGRIFALNLWFSAGLIAVFLVLATAAAFANLGWGEQFTLLWFKVTMVAVVFAFALSFLGVWEVPIPGFAQSSTSSKLQQKEGPAGAFFKGVFTTLLATPCSGPFLGSTFGYTLAQPPIVTYVIFLSVGLGMALPYLVIGTFPGLVRWLPKPGAWMDTFKQVMAFFLLGTVVFLFTTIPADYFIATLALVVGVWFACWIIGRVPVYESAGKQLTAWAGGVAAATVVGLFAFMFLGPVKELLDWQPYSPEALAKLQSEGKTVMIDFTAQWCPTCKWNLKTAINTPRVKELVEKNQVVPVLADWTDKGPTIEAKLEELNSRSIPLMAIYPAGKPGEVIVLRDLLLESQVIDALEKAGPSKPAEGAAAAEQVASFKAGAD